MNLEDKLIIGAYYLAPYASTREHVCDLVRCGIDLVINMRNDRAALDLLAEAGVGAVVSGIVPGWFGGDGSNAGTMSEKNPLERYERAADDFIDHPAIAGIDTGDEPSSADFAHYAKAIDVVKRRFPGKIPYLNIYPSYALKGANTPEEIKAQLGTDSYREYIARYVQTVDTPYICFDYYLYSASISGLYESMETVSDACAAHGREMWTVLQVNSHLPEVFVSEAQLRFQACCALAFGARRIIWACYCAGWWHNHVLDREGNRTEQYEKLKNVNAQLHRFAQEYMKCRHGQTVFVGGFSPEELKHTQRKAQDRFDGKHIFSLCADGARLLVGSFSPRAQTPGEALVIAAADDPRGETIRTHRIRFESDAKVRVVGLQGEIPLERDEDGMYVITLHTCDAAMLIAQ